ncbi:MAG TPA: FkbM family methyltransferase [Longimicrobiales bacterium]|nr:FkbM family methyltransferase [Longimicrobiales bacterium]
MMRHTLVRAGKLVWRATPSRAIRELYLQAFTRLVRQRRTTVEVEGIRFALDLGETIDLSLFLEQYERDVVEVIRAVCRPGWRVLDIGANIGAHALRLARMVGPSGAVYAFEPTEYAFAKLRRNVELNGFGHLVPTRVALSDENRPAQPLDVRASWRTDGQAQTAACTVDFRRLDDWCDEHGVDAVDFVKLDVDGFEYAVLAGGERVLSRARPPLVMEVGAWHFADPARNPLSLLRRWGYRSYRVLRGERHAQPDELRRYLPEHDEAMSYSINVLATAE